MPICTSSTRKHKQSRAWASTSDCTDACRAPWGKDSAAAFAYVRGRLACLQGPITALSRGVGARPTVAKQRVCDFHFQPLVLDIAVNTKAAVACFLLSHGELEPLLLSGVRGLFPRLEKQEGQSHASEMACSGGSEILSVACRLECLDSTYRLTGCGDDLCSTDTRYVARVASACDSTAAGS